MQTAAPHGIQTERFEVDQYVRVQLSTGRSEIGVVVSIDEANGTIVIATRHGYNITVRSSSVRRAFLLVLDLNGVLVSRGRGSFVDRPGVFEFINFVMNNFVVAVWTSGLERTSNPIIEKVFDGFQDRLLFKLYRDACTMRPTPEKPYRTIKNLQRIFDTYPKSFHAVNTIIVDDSPDKCSHPDIALCPVPFNDPVKQMEDDGLTLAMEVLKEVLQTESLAPLIRAGEERLVALAAQEEKKKEEMEKENEEILADSSHNKTAIQSELPATLLWAARLCCDYISGGCNRTDCRYSHSVDDGKQPCSQKGDCRRGHAKRWIDAVPLAENEETSRDAVMKSFGALSQLGMSNIFSLFSTNPDRQKEERRREETWNKPQSTQQQRQQNWQQKQQQPQQKEQQPQQNNRRQREGKTGGIGEREREGGRQRGFNNSSFGKTDVNNKMSLSTSGTNAMRFTGDRQDGNALLRQLQESLLISKNSDGPINMETNRGKNRRS